MMASIFNSGMDENLNSNPVLNTLSSPTKPHLKPLSVFSRRVMCDQNNSLIISTSTGLFDHFKVGMINKSGKKRKLDDSDCTTPALKRPSPEAPSPDLGCCVDYCTPPEERGSTSPFTPSHPESSAKTQVFGSALRQTLVSSLHRTVTECRSSSDSGCNMEAGQQTVHQRLSNLFDRDVDDLFCLNPLTQTEQGKADGGVKCEPAAVQADCVSTLDVDKRKESSHEVQPQVHDSAPLCIHHLSFLNDLNVSASGLVVEPPVSSPAHCLEGELEEAWSIGAPRFESSVCQSSPTGGRKKQRSEGQDEPIVISDGSITEDSIWESTLPPQVQVKSEVVVPSRSSNCKSDRGRSSLGSRRRPVVYGSKTEWESHKKQYVYSVTSHMSEKPGGTRGVMTELLDLMTNVAGQTNTNGVKWRHPSDLTSRNYQKKFGTYKMTLSEWQVRNQPKHKRFSKIPKSFERSLFH